MREGNDIPFYIAAPRSTFDLLCESCNDIPIEERDSREVTEIAGVSIAGAGTAVRNPAHYVTGIITENGIIDAMKEEIEAYTTGRYGKQ